MGGIRTLTKSNRLTTGPWAVGKLHCINVISFRFNPKRHVFEVWRMSDDFWKTKIRITCEEKQGKCSAHKVGDSFVYSYPGDYIKKLCPGIQDPARPWVHLCAARIPSWEADDSNIYRIHCISKKGTVWRIERVTDESKV
ncbi:MAG: hypothetical protein JSV51_08815 [Candidatus Bathyarchaeota archaeon]|nr:MAG: hypothetical protein JSV51_08815 [Candidatus Bathyarchaeota archaeon]